MESVEHATIRWGLYPWFPEHGTKMIHPDDFDRFSSLPPNGKVFESICVDDGYLVLKYGERTFRVTPQLFKEVNPPSKRIGDVVKVESNGRIVQGVVVEVHWHHQKNEPFFFIMMNGKHSSKRYWETDFR